MNQEKSKGSCVTRRDFLRCSAAVAGVASLHAPGTFAETPDKPNILFIMTDQQTASAMSCAGNPYLRTPALDALAARGVRFERAYVTQPLCMPCRSSLQTGLYPHENGVVCNGLDIQGDFPMLGTMMADAGYENTYIK